MRLQNRFVLVFLFILFSTTVHATPSYKQSEFDRVTTWNKITDYVATLGKNEIEKKEILRERKADRKKKRIQKAQDEAREEQMKRLHSLKSSYISR